MEIIIRSTGTFLVKNSTSLIALLISLFAYRNSKYSLSYKKKLDFIEKQGLFYFEMSQCWILFSEILSGTNEVKEILSYATEKIQKTDTRFGTINNTIKKLEDISQSYLTLTRKSKTILDSFMELNGKLEPHKYEK